jgi:hypothetical protein
MQHTLHARNTHASTTEKKDVVRNACSELPLPAGRPSKKSLLARKEYRCWASRRLPADQLAKADGLWLHVTLHPFAGMDSRQICQKSLSRTQRPAKIPESGSTTGSVCEVRLFFRTRWIRRVQARHELYAQVRQASTLEPLQVLAEPAAR